MVDVSRYLRYLKIWRTGQNLHLTTPTSLSSDISYNKRFPMISQVRLSTPFMDNKAAFQSDMRQSQGQKVI